MEDLIKLSILHQFICRFKKNFNKNTSNYFVDHKMILKFILKGKVTGIAKTILKKRIMLEYTLLPYFKTVQNLIGIVWYWWKDWYINQWNRIEYRNRPSEVQPTDFWQRSKSIQLRMDSFFQWMVLEQLNILMLKHKLWPKPHTLWKN